MCQSSTNVQATRELRLAGGRVVQCMSCGRLGVELGTTYILFAEDDFVNFARCLEKFASECGKGHREKSVIQVQEDSNTMLVLSRSELLSAAELLRAAVPWLQGYVGATSQIPVPSLEEGIVN